VNGADPSILLYTDRPGEACDGRHVPRRGLRPAFGLPGACGGSHSPAACRESHFSSSLLERSRGLRIRPLASRGK